MTTPSLEGTQMSAFEDALANGPISQAQALALYDGLEATTLDFMLGPWAGEPFPTGHPMDGALEATGWRGKRFDAVDAVHPLLFDDGAKGVFAVDPVRFMSNPSLSKAAVRRVELETDLPTARLRILVHRGVATAAMIYDGLAIIDSFRRVDQNTVLGLMDMRGMPLPYFFLLRRVESFDPQG